MARHSCRSQGRITTRINTRRKSTRNPKGRANTGVNQANGKPKNAITL